MDRGVDDERRSVERPISVDDLALVVHEEEILHLDLLEIDAERIDPEVVQVLRVASGDVAGRTLVEPKMSEESHGCGKSLLAVASLVGDVVERRIRVGNTV